MHVSQIADVITYASTLTTCCDALTPALTVPAVAEALQCSSIGALRDDVLAVVAQLADAHHCPAGTQPRIEPPLVDVWDRAAGGPLEEVIDAAFALGVDAELICWHLISLESVRHIGLIRKEASKIVKKMPHTVPDDLMGYGWSGLRAALRAYDPALGFAFSTYACPRINGAIRDGVRGESPLPKRLTTLARSASTAEEVLTHRLARNPTYEEITEYLEVGAQAALLPRLTPSASLDELTNPWRETSREPSCLIDRTDPSEEAWRHMCVDAVRAALADLPPDEAELVTMIYLQDQSLAETARVLGRDLRDLRKVKKRAMSSLAAALGEWQSVPVG